MPCKNLITSTSNSMLRSIPIRLAITSLMISCSVNRLRFASAFVHLSPRTPPIVRKGMHGITNGWIRAAQRIGTQDANNVPGSALNMWSDQKKIVSSRSSISSSSFSGGTKERVTNRQKIDIGENIGWGSYGTVNLCNFVVGEGDGMEGTKEEGKKCICKRAWTEEELMEREGIEKSSREVEQRAKRCQYYLDVEKHCFEKLQQSGDPESNLIPEMIGSFLDSKGKEWLVFHPIERSADGTPAISLADAIKMDWKDQHSSEIPHHHLYMIQHELDLDPSSTFGETLDVLFESLLKVVSSVHSSNIVHRDVKPANLLIDPTRQSLILIDFGSAADMSITKSSFSASLFGSLGMGGRIGLDGNTVAVSPIYAAPEVFVRWDRSPLEFDTFSCALIFCQLLFNFLDERTEAAFRQQMEDVGYDLDVWLAQELSSTLRPVGIEDGISYLGERQGLWQLLKDMFLKDPERRITSQKSLKHFRSILTDVREGNIIESSDGSFFESVLASMEACELVEDVDTPTETSQDTMMIMPRPLHFVATFSRSESLGLVLSEADEYLGDDQDEDFDTEMLEKWNKATRDVADPKDVFVRGIAETSQSEKMGIFEIGDRLRAVGEIPIAGGGFEKVVGLLSQQPRSAKTVKLHFDRKPTIPSMIPKTANHLVHVVEQGVWSSTGRRKAQEDHYVLHEIINDQDTANPYIMAGIFDGHGGKAAALTASQLLPSLFAEQIAATNSSPDLAKILESSWMDTCSTYQNGCDESKGSCIADYDPREGIILAHTGSTDLVAGTTATVALFKKESENCVILNCGDSRTLIVGNQGEVSQTADTSTHRSSVVLYSTRDHSPKCELEIQRLKLGRESLGLDYSVPECSTSRWWLTVGDYQYAVSRSLEGVFAASKGIVYDADVEVINLSNILSQKEGQEGGAVLVLASDGLFEVVDNEQVGREVLRMREQGLSAADAAKDLCGLALKKGTSDNVSVVLVYLD